MNALTKVAAAAFVAPGIGHFLRPDFFEAVVPDWFPDKKLANQVSGAAEIALGLGLLWPRTRRIAGIGLMGLTAAVFPANIDMAVNDVDLRKDENGKYQRFPGEVSDARNWIRLPFQAVYFWLIWKGAGLGSGKTPAIAEIG